MDGPALRAASTVVEGGAAQDIPALRGESDVADHDVRVVVEVLFRLIEAGRAAMVRDVRTGARRHAAPRGARTGISVTS